MANEIRYLIFDLDGTAMPAIENALPSEKVIRAVGLAREHIKVSAATGRSLFKAKKIITALGLSDPCIVSGGTQLVRPNTGEILWQKSIEKETALKVLDKISKYSAEFFVGYPNKVVKSKKIDQDQPVNVLYVLGLTKSDTTSIIHQLTEFSDVAAHFMVSWSKGRFDVHITNTDATKKNAMEELLAISGIPSSQVMVVGDGGNDLPLYELAGIKVAMGNADDFLKSKADIIADTVDNDGLAKLIEEVILPQFVIK